VSTVVTEAALENHHKIKETSKFKSPIQKKEIFFIVLQIFLALGVKMLFYCLVVCEEFSLHLLFVFLCDSRDVLRNFRDPPHKITPNIKRKNLKIAKQSLLKTL
jgi:hypothetical protein